MNSPGIGCSDNAGGFVVVRTEAWQSLAELWCFPSLPAPCLLLQPEQNSHIVRQVMVNGTITTIAGVSRASC